MGSMITLGLGKLEVDWGKNNYFRNHSKLFQIDDIKKISYYYADDIEEFEEGYSKQLKHVKPRLELLGYTFDTLEEIFDSHIAKVEEYEQAPDIVFSRLVEIIQAINISNFDFDDENEPYDYDFGEFVKKYLFKQEGFIESFSEDELLSCNLATFLESIDVYFLLRILAENDDNLELNLEWRYSDVVDGGWVTLEDIQQGLEDSDKYLIVTEGSSDSFIINKTIKLLFPEIADFFYFVDMEEHYPFTGTGNLYRFSQGLSSINIQNNVVIIYDNDVAGIEKFVQTQKLKLPKNMKVMHLPKVEDFKKFNTVGPQGNSLEDINSKAVAIELFLDLSYQEERAPSIRWTSYSKDLDSYQGELEYKDTYVTRFKKIKTFDDGYNNQKLKLLISEIIRVCVSVHI